MQTGAPFSRAAGGGSLTALPIAELDAGNLSAYIPTNLISPDDSHIVVSCHEQLDDELAYNLAKAIDLKKRDLELCSIQMDYGQRGVLPVIEPTYWTSLTGQIDRQWDEKITGAPLHDGARRYYKEIGVL